MEQQALMVGGHVWKRIFSISDTEDDPPRYCEFEVPGGALLAASILFHYVQPLQVPDGIKREYCDLALLGSEKHSHFCIGKYLGWVEGEHLILQDSGDVPDMENVSDTGDVFETVNMANDRGVFDTRDMSGTGEALILWDEGFGETPTIPDGTMPILWASARRLPDATTTTHLTGRSILMLDVEVLRKSGAMISRQLSWERSATDVVWQILENPTFRHLNTLEHLVIVFAEDGAVYINRSGVSMEAHLILAHGGGEGTMRSSLPGTLPDTWALMVAGLSLQVRAVVDEGKKLSLYPALKAADRLLEVGYERSILEEGRYDIWLDYIAAEEDDHEFIIPIGDPSEGSDPGFWCIGNEAGGGKMSRIAFDYVKNGASAIDGLPQLSIGDLITIDRKEIESFQNIKNLIVEYSESSPVRPLSIAVFGAPGSGKSYGVTQIAKNVMPGLVEKLEFNVSQFTDFFDLATAFHKVRDVILQGKLPLVFFDEFDSDYDGRSLGWLKYFLMPMQDGKFKDADGNHPVGKCILVFAGGTSACFEQFASPMDVGESETVKQFEDVKGPDFISRLHGAIDVLGPNPDGTEDSGCVLRRALLLRSLCSRKLSQHGGELAIDDAVLRAMLFIPKYKYGTRSMEAIIDMSRIEEGVWGPTSLPFITQLERHVDAEAFTRLVLNEVRLASYTEKLARAAHGEYCQQELAMGKTGPNVVPWEELPEDIQEDNRRQIRLIAEKLEKIGCAFDAGDTVFTSLEEFSPEEVEKLARFEHDMWMEAKRAHGYEYGPVRNDEPFDKEGNPQKLTHPDLLPWEELSVDAQRKDRNTVINIIPFLGSAGLRVYRMQ